MISRFLVFIWLLPTVLLLAGFPLEAQQSTKIPRIGYVSGTGSSSDLALTSRHYDKDSVTSVISMGKTS
jgi:hypothetical protein